MTEDENKPKLEIVDKNQQETSLMFTESQEDINRLVDIFDALLGKEAVGQGRVLLLHETTGSHTTIEMAYLIAAGMPGDQIDIIEINSEDPPANLPPNPDIMQVTTDEDQNLLRIAPYQHPESSPHSISVQRARERQQEIAQYLNKEVVDYNPLTRIKPEELKDALDGLSKDSHYSAILYLRNQATSDESATSFENIWSSVDGLVEGGARTKVIVGNVSKDYPIEKTAAFLNEPANNRIQAYVYGESIKRNPSDTSKPELNIKPLGLNSLVYLVKI